MFLKQAVRWILPGLLVGSISGQAEEFTADRIPIQVRNNCPFTLWIHAFGSQEVLGPDDAPLTTGATRVYHAPSLWTAARVEAYKNGPRQNQIEKVEMTFDRNPHGEQVLHYNITYVDWVGLPVSVSSIGGGGDCRPAGCNRPVSQILNGCPAHLRTADKCLSARTFCLDPGTRHHAYCRALDGRINECADRYGDCQGARGASTAEVYACSGPFFSQNPKYCAALNRGMLHDPYNVNTGNYYKNPPYNTYARWAHETCPGIYALAYDDFPPAAEESGFHSCVNGQQLNITFCPAG